jgi:hypothetical protein
MGNPCHSIRNRAVCFRQRCRCGNSRGGMGEGRPPLAALHGTCWAAVEDASPEINPAAGRIWHPLQPQNRIVACAGVEADQDEAGQMAVNAEVVPLAVRIPAERSPQELRGWCASGGAREVPTAAVGLPESGGPACHASNTSGAPRRAPRVHGARSQPIHASGWPWPERLFVHTAKRHSRGRRRL